MSADMLATLQSLDRAVLNEVVRQDQRSATFEVIDWTVEQLHFLQVQDSTGGLYVFKGNGRDKDDHNKPWSVVLKILKRPASEGDPYDLLYWKRELLAFQSGLLADIPSAVSVPRCYGVTEKADSGWIWIEYIQQATRPRTSLEDFRLAAHQAGLFGGAYLMGKPPARLSLAESPAASSDQRPFQFLDGISESGV